MCCFPLGFSDVVVKVMRDGDGDGKCQEENGKWVPCPPGVAAGTRLRNGKPLGQTIADLASAPSSPTPTPTPAAAPRRVFTSPTPARSDDPGVEYLRNTNRPIYTEWLAARRIERRTLSYDELRDNFAIFEQQRNEEYARRKNEKMSSLRKQSPELFGEDGKILPELIDKYVSERRAKAADRAKRIEQQAKVQISPESKAAARAITIPVEPDEYDLRRTYEFDNPRPQRDDFDEDSQGLEEFREAFIQWEEDRENWVWNEINEVENSLRNMEGDIGRAFQHTMTGTDGKTYKSIVTGSSWDIDEGLGVVGEIRDERGMVVGEFHRQLFYGGDPDTVYHASLSFDTDHQGLGLASQFNAMNEIIYRELGISTIQVTGASSAGSMVGATHWPAVGYDWADDWNREDFLNLIQEAIDEAAVEDPIEYEILQELLAAAQDGDALTAGDFVHWKGAIQFFKDKNASFSYMREI